MNLIGTQNIETKRLILRRFRIDDAEKMYENYAHSELVTKFLTWSPHQNKEETKKLLKIWEKEYENNSCFNWAIILKEKGDEPIGGISVVHLDEVNSVAEVGYCLSDKYWHQGITSEALEAVINFLFNKVEVETIIAEHDINNVNSGKVMKHCHMTYEGILPEKKPNNQGMVTTVRYSLKRKDYIQ